MTMFQEEEYDRGLSLEYIQQKLEEELLTLKRTWRYEDHTIKE